MGVSTATNRNDYTGTGALSSYDYDFRIFEASDLEVIVRDPDGVETLLVIATDYEVNDVGEEPGGDIDLVDLDQAWLTSGNLTTGWHLSIRRVMPLVQDTDIRNQGAYFPDVIEDQFDKLVMIDQQQQDEIDRSIKVPASEDSTGMEVPAVEVRAGNLFGWDADGDPIATSAGVNTALVTPFMETVLDDANAAAARATLGAQQDISALTSLTAPALADVLGIYDDDAATHKKITPDNLLKVIALLTKNTAPLAADVIASYDSANSVAKGLYLPAAFAGAKQAGTFSNIGFTASTDALTIGGATASQSASNPAYINMPDTSSFGRVTTLAKTSDVVLTLGTAHFGFDTLGNLTNAELWVIAINDGSGTLKYGITVQGGLNQVVSTFTETVAANVTLATKILVNATLAVGTWPCFPLGYVLANRNDATNAWTLVTTVGGLNVGGKIQDITGSVFFNATFTGLGTVTGANFYHQRVGNRYKVWGDATTGTVDASTASISLPNSKKVALEASPGTTGFIGRYFKSSASATTIKAGPMTATSGDAFATFSYDDYTTALSPYGFRAGNVVFTNTMTFSLFFEVAILGLSNN